MKIQQALPTTHTFHLRSTTIVVYLQISGLRRTLTDIIVIIVSSPTAHLLKEMMKLPYDKISCALTPSIKSNSEVGTSFAVPSSSKRRRVSDEENNGPTPVTLLDSFIDSVSSYRDEDTRKKARNQHIDSDSDDEEEDIREDDDHHHDENFAKKLAHEKSKQLLLERITRANSQSTSMEGEFDELVMVIAKAKLYENKEGGWIDRGLCAIKFLRDVEEGEYTFGMIRMRLVMANLNESITLKIDDFEASRMNSSSTKPSYAWKALGTPMYSLRFSTVTESLQWKNFYDKSREINRNIRQGRSGSDAADTNAGDNIIPQMASLSTKSCTTP